MQNCFGKFDATSFQEIILSSGVFRRETASGFYPWGKVEGPRKRVAEGLCGWRHGNSFPMTQSAQSHRQMRSIPLCSKAVFLCFCLIPPTIRQQFNTCLACFNDLLVIMLRFGVGIIALCCYLYAFGICCFGIISDPLRGSTQGWGIVTKLRSFAPAELHSLAWCFA